MQRTFLFLQGPHGPFFKELGRHLKSCGYRVLRINFNGGDWFDWFGRDAVSFTGRQQEWPSYLIDLIKHKRITDIVLYGDCRSLHKIAIYEAVKKRLRVHVFEEGYIRPKWITYENGGVNGNSHLFDSIDTIEPLTENVEDSLAQKVGPSQRWILFYCVRYYLIKALWSFRFSHYARHRPYRPYQEALLWGGNLLRMPLLHMRSNQRRERLFQNNTPYFLVGLQLDSDAQLREHSKYLSMADFVNEILRSFAQYAPKGCHLVFKKHPYDPGAIPYETLVRLEAYSLGIRDRVLFLHSGSLPELIKRSRGVVLMNSTVGTSALHHGRPTIALGTAIYDIPGLTWQGSLDEFWQGVKGPDRATFAKFYDHLMREALVNGGFFTSRGRRLAIAGCVDRMLIEQSHLRECSENWKVISMEKNGIVVNVNL
jgi:capsular polysaccharide export protein